MAIGTATAILGAAALGALSSNKAAKTQASAAGQAAELQKSQYEQTREDQAPYRTAGYNALAEMQRTAGNVPGAFKFGNEAMYQDPGYAFRLSEGQKALDRSAAARGGLISGGALKAATRYGQDMGSQEYQAAYNRALTGYNTGVASENQLYNRQAGLAGIGQTATNLVGQAGQNYATNAGNAMGAGAQAAASGYMGMANAAGQGVGQYLNYTSNNNLIDALQRNQNMQLINTGGFSNTPSYMVNPNR
jgi:hypothetical protein